MRCRWIPDNTSWYQSRALFSLANPFYSRIISLKCFGTFCYLQLCQICSSILPGDLFRCKCKSMRERWISILCVVCVCDRWRDQSVSLSDWRHTGLRLGPDQTRTWRPEIELMWPKQSIASIFAAAFVDHQRPQIQKDSSVANERKGKFNLSSV